MGLKLRNMKRLSTYKKWLGLAVAVIVFALILPVIAHAEDERETYALGQATATVNVREGAGENTYAVIQYHGSNLQLTPGTQVIILEEQVYTQTGKVWYKVIFYLNGEELSGWVTSTYISKIGTVTATPTPTPEATPTPDVTDTPEVTPTPEEIAATSTPIPTPEPVITEDSSIYKTFWKTVVALLVIAVIIIILIYAYNRYQFAFAKKNEVKKKMKYLKNVDIDESEANKNTTVAGAKRPSVRVVADDTNEIVESTSNVIDERVALRQKLDNLKEHDLVTHKFFGKGEVYDNSDVKLIEVRFGMDVRYLNKDSLAAKNLLSFDEDAMLTKRKL